MPDLVTIDVNVTRAGGHGNTYALRAGDDLGLQGMLRSIVGVGGRTLLESSLVKLVTYAKELCPVASGNLQDSIEYEIYEDGKNGAFGTLDESKAPYAYYVNYGWSGHPEGEFYLEGALDMLKSDLM
jgi:hypothetical protein